MAQINSSGQVYVLNGFLTVSNPNGQYLATGSPVLLAGSMTCPASSFDTQGFTPPTSAMGVVVIGRNGILNKRISIQNGPNNVPVFDANVNEIGQIEGVFAGGNTTGCSITITDLGGGAETFDVYWCFDVPNPGLVLTPQGSVGILPSGAGIESVITNRRVPVRLGDDYIGMQNIGLAIGTSQSGTLIAAPGAAFKLVIWHITGGLVASAASGLRFSDSVSGTRIFDIFTATVLSDNHSYGGLALPANHGISYSSDANCSVAEIGVWYTTELAQVVG